jgi:class 3 adenylate cyclase
MADDSFPSPPTPENIARKLAAILNADIHSFSRVMGAAEEATLWTLQGHRQVTDSLIQQHRGRIVGTAGDSILAEFASVVDAVRCAVAIQQQLKARNAALPEDQRLEFRIGINLGDVMVDGDQIYGDGVNIAARVQAIADPGGICISGAVYEQVKNKLALHYEDLGEQAVKNIAEPVRVYRVVLEPTAAVSAKEETSAKSKVESAKSKVESAKSKVESPQSKVESPKPRRVGTTVFVLVFVSVFLLGGIVAVRYLLPSIPNTQPLAAPQHSGLSTQD